MELPEDGIIFHIVFDFLTLISHMSVQGLPAAHCHLSLTASQRMTVRASHQNMCHFVGCG